MPPDPQSSAEQRRHVERILDLYRRHPQTTGRVRKADRSLANDLYRQGIDIDTFEAALLIVAARRWSITQQPASTIRSLHYFLPAIREVTQRPLDAGYLEYLRELTRQQPRPVHQAP